MKEDVLAMAEGRMTAKRPSKETLNHPGLIQLASGIDPYLHTPMAYRTAYKNLGIDIINRVPERNAPSRLRPGETRSLKEGYREAYLGLYSTIFRTQFRYERVEDFWNANDFKLDYVDLITPVPHELDSTRIAQKMALLGDIGVYYYMLYTTLFMWAVEYLGWEVFLTAAAMDPEAFDRKFWDLVLPKSMDLITSLSEIDSPIVFCHDDLASARGPVFAPDWYDRYIFPRYVKLWEPAKSKGRKLIFVADGNMSALLKPLRDTGVDGVMMESPATDFDSILDVFHDRIIIGGIDTRILATGSPAAVAKHVAEIGAKTRGVAGYVMSSSGGLNGEIPLVNLEAYFDARVRTGHTAKNWRHSNPEQGSPDA